MGLTKKTVINYEEGEGNEKILLQGPVVMRRLSFSEKNSLEEESTEIKFFGTTPQVKISTGRMKELAILKSVTSASLELTTFDNGVEHKTSYPLDIGGVQKLPQDVGELLFEMFGELNTLSEKKKDI